MRSFPEGYTVYSTNGQLMVWVGVGGLDSDWIPENERTCYLGVSRPRIPNHRAPNHQSTISWYTEAFFDSICSNQETVRVKSCIFLLYMTGQGSMLMHCWCYTAIREMLTFLEFALSKWLESSWIHNINLDRFFEISPLTSINGFSFLGWSLFHQAAVPGTLVAWGV